MPQAGRIGVLAPHPDDAALSLGATIAHATRVGCEVVVVSVFAGDPRTTLPAGAWDRRCGFKDAGQAAARRREEDTRACRLLGAQSVQLPFDDDQYATGRDQEGIWAAVERELGAVGALLVPGFPLLHPDHRWVTTAAVARRQPGVRLGFYVEQPYAMWEVVGGRDRRGRLAIRAAQALRTKRAQRRQIPCLPSDLAAHAGSVRWETPSAGPRARRVKLRAVRAYQSQLRGFGRGFVPQVLLYEWAGGGEVIAWAPEPPAAEPSSER